MRLKEILRQLPQDAIESLAKNVLTQGVDIRLPHTVLVDELSEILDSASYLTKQIALRHPPFFEIMTLLMNAPGYSLPADGFRQKVREETDRMIALANRSPIFPKPKNYNLYLRMLEGAWEEEAGINASEANLLRILRDELRLSLMEHFIIEHHPNLHKYWRIEQAYELERNHLLNTGILFALGESYCLCEETVAIIRRAWGIELSEVQFKRLLDVLSNEDLSEILGNESLPTSGVAEEKKSRIQANIVSPRIALLVLSLDRLRDAAYKLGCRQSGAKDDVIDNILDWLDADEDLKKNALHEAKAVEEQKALIPEPREISKEALSELLDRLTQDALYDIISHLPSIRKSGTKTEKITRLVDSPFSEISILKRLNNDVLSGLCRQRFVNPYGPKEEKISRILKSYLNYVPHEKINVTVPSIDEKLQQNSGDPKSNAATMELGELRTEYPYLNEHQIIILHYILTLKSLSDLELEKLVVKHHIPWIFIKAKMEELVDLLRQNCKEIISIRGFGDLNIYESLN